MELPDIDKISLLGFSSREPTLLRRSTKFRLWADFITNLSSWQRSLQTGGRRYRGPHTRVRSTYFTGTDCSQKRHKERSAGLKAPVLQGPGTADNHTSESCGVTVKPSPFWEPWRTENCHFWLWYDQLDSGTFLEEENTKNLIQDKAWNNVEKHEMKLNRILF